MSTCVVINGVYGKLTRGFLQNISQELESRSISNRNCYEFVMDSTTDVDYLKSINLGKNKTYFAGSIPLDRELFVYFIHDELLLIANFVLNNPYKSNEGSSRETDSDTIDKLLSIYMFSDHPTYYKYPGTDKRSKSRLSMFAFIKQPHKKIVRTVNRRLNKGICAINVVYKLAKMTEKMKQKTGT